MTADDVEWARAIFGYRHSPHETQVAAALTAKGQDARRHALEEAAQVAKAGADLTSGSDIQFVSPAKFASDLALDIGDNIRALADKPASPDIISLVRALRRAVESTSVGDPLKMPEWRALCAAMNEIDKQL